MAAVPKNSHLTVYRIFPPVESPVKAKKNAACWAGSVFLLWIGAELLEIPAQGILPVRQRCEAVLRQLALIQPAVEGPRRLGRAVFRGGHADRGVYSCGR